MKKINLKGVEWEPDDTHCKNSLLNRMFHIERDVQIAESINSIIDFLENDLDKKLKDIIEKEIESRFDILDL